MYDSIRHLYPFNRSYPPLDYSDYRVNPPVVATTTVSAPKLNWDKPIEFSYNQFSSWLPARVICKNRLNQGQPQHTHLVLVQDGNVEKLVYCNTDGKNEMGFFRNKVAKTKNWTVTYRNNYGDIFSRTYTYDPAYRVGSYYSGLGTVVHVASFELEAV